SAQATHGAHAAVLALDLACLGEVVALQRGQHFAQGHDFAGQVRGDQVAQGSDVLRFQVLELATDAVAGVVDRAHLQVDVHGQAKVVDDELQASLDDLTFAEFLPGRSNEAQAAGRQVFDT